MFVLDCVVLFDECYLVLFCVEDFGALVFGVCVVGFVYDCVFVVFSFLYLLIGLWFFDCGLVYACCVGCFEI